MMTYKVKKFNRSLFILGLTTMFSTVSLAAEEPSKMGLFIEPAITYETGDTSTSYPSPFANSSGKVEGFGLGARLGIHLYESFFVGVDGRYAMPNLKDSSLNYDAKATSTNLGPVIGMQMPNLGLRVWGTYILSGDLDPEKSGNYDVKFQDAKGYRIGTGFHVASVSLNVEYQELKYGKTNLEQIGPFSPGTTLSDVKLENRSWIASVSFPVEF
jgi:hypothetical protein